MAFIDIDHDLWARTQMRRAQGKCRWCGAKGTIERDTESDNPFLICKGCDDADGPDLKLALLKRWW